MINLVHILIYGNDEGGGWERTLLDPKQIPQGCNYKLIIVNYNKINKQLQAYLQKKYDIIYVIDKLKSVMAIPNLDRILNKHQCTHILFTSHTNQKVINLITNKKDNLFYIHHGLVASRWCTAEKLTDWSREMNYIVAQNILYGFIKKFTKNVYQINGLPQVDLLYNIHQKSNKQKDSLLITINVPENRKKEFSKELIEVLGFFEKKYKNILIKEKSLGIKSCASNVKKGFPQVTFVNRKDCLYKYFNVDCMLHINYGSAYPESLIVHDNVILYEPEYSENFAKYKNFKVIKSLDELKDVNLDQPIPKESIAEFFRDEFGVDHIIDNFTEKFCEYLINVNS